MQEDRERARRLATSVVSFAIGLVGVTLVVFAVFLLARGGAAFLFLSLLLLALGAGVALIGLFFQLVPMKLDALAEDKRDYDRRTRPP